MHITQLYTYPIKSLRGASLTSSRVTKYGFPYDRRFMILKIHSEDPSSKTQKRFQNMTVTNFPQMGLFIQELRLSQSGNSPAVVVVTYQAPKQSRSTQLEVPLEPSTDGLEVVDVILHNSPTKAYNMGGHYNEWFSTCFGCEVVLVYLGSHLRPVLGNLSPNATNKQKSETGSWLSTIASQLPSIGTAKDISEDGITFADVAPYLMTTEESLNDVSSRLPDEEQMDIRKFRPNIVISGAPSAYDEEFWGALLVKSRPESEDGKKSVRFELTQNCGRCRSINIDYSTGDFGDGESGKVLKKLMGDRRVDRGWKYSPIFGRYGFLDGSDTNGTIAIGDNVEIGKRNTERSTFEWPGLGN